MLFLDKTGNSIFTVSLFLSGSFFGVLLNLVFPPAVIFIILIFCLSIAIRSTVMQGCKLYKEEKLCRNSTNIPELEQSRECPPCQGGSCESEGRMSSPKKQEKKWVGVKPSEDKRIKNSRNDEEVFNHFSIEDLPEKQDESVEESQRLLPKASSAKQDTGPDWPLELGAIVYIAANSTVHASGRSRRKADFDVQYV